MALSVGFIGVGNMGNPMAGNVLKAGFSMTVFDLNPKAMENLIQAGAKRAASAKEVVDASDVVLTSLPASPDVEAMYLDEGGLVQRAKPGTILIDLSSVLPKTPRRRRGGARKGAARAERHGAQHLPRGAGGRGQHHQGDQQHDGVREQRHDDGRLHPGREGRARPDDDL